jgi:hypothetical protein
MRGLPTSSAQWIWSQFTLADHAFVWLSKTLYLILKFAVVLRQSFDDDIRSLPHIQACRKQTRTNLEFMHDAHHAVTLRSRLEQVHAKGTNIGALQGTSWLADFPHAIIFSAQHSSLRQRIKGDFVRLFEDEDFRVTRVGDRRQFPALLAQII